MVMNLSAQVAQKVEAADSPASFPSTPFSRMEIMNRTTEKVDSVMFAARDRLRLVGEKHFHIQYLYTYVTCLYLVVEFNTRKLSLYLGTSSADEPHSPRRAVGRWLSSTPARHPLVWP